MHECWYLHVDCYNNSKYAFPNPAEDYMHVVIIFGVLLITFVLLPWCVGIKLFPFQQ